MDASDSLRQAALERDSSAREGRLRGLVPDDVKRSPATAHGGAVVVRGARWGLATMLLALAAIGWFLISLQRHVEAAAFTQVDLAAVRVDSGPGWVDERWPSWLRARLAQLPPLAADAPGAVESVRGALEELPFVAEVGAVRVLWPDALRLEVRWREPIAAVRLGSSFALLSSEGVVLPGEWSAPPPRAFGYFPVVAAPSSARAELVCGAWLDSEVWHDGLSVARALEAGLAPDDWLRAGRIVIDAQRAASASVEDPGVVLWLEGGRRAYFGRSPNLGEPGELPPARKCASLSRALRLLDSGPAHFDWELVDLRWDRPELLPRGGWQPEASGASERRATTPSRASSAPNSDSPANSRTPSGVR